jgi:hypothetical protein
MNTRKPPHWILNEDWAISTDTYNWILYRLSGKGWRAVGYYPTPEMLLKSFHRKLTRSETNQPTLEQHVEHCLRVAQAASESFMKSLGTYPLPALKARPAAVTAMLKREVVDHAS